MTLIDVDTSPLQAAREWRGIGLVAVAVNSGLPVVQAEALESGDPAAFDSIDEMIAAAVLYGASIGIGRDEAMALLDRTVGREAANVQIPDSASRPNDGFSVAVAQRSALMAQRAGDSSVSTPEIVVEPTHPSSLEASLPLVPEGPTPEQAVAASGELHLDVDFAPDVPWERSSSTGELEAWVDEYDDADSSNENAYLAKKSGAARVGGALRGACERVLGTDRTASLSSRVLAGRIRTNEILQAGRARLQRSEHATLIVAISAGAVLIALVVALGGAITEDKPSGPPPVERSVSQKQIKADKKDEATKAAEQTAAPKPVIPPARLTVDVYNAGSKKGRAKDVAAQVKAAGYKVGTVANTKSDYTGATIIHPADMGREARALARRTGVTSLQVAPGSSANRHITLIVE